MPQGKLGEQSKTCLPKIVLAFPGPSFIPLLHRAVHRPDTALLTHLQGGESREFPLPLLARNMMWGWGQRSFSEEAVRSPGTSVKDGREPPCGCCGLNLGPLGEQPVLLTSGHLSSSQISLLNSTLFQKPKLKTNLRAGT